MFPFTFGVMMSSQDPTNADKQPLKSSVMPSQDPSNADKQPLKSSAPEWVDSNVDGSYFVTLECGTVSFKCNQAGYFNAHALCAQGKISIEVFLTQSSHVLSFLGKRALFVVDSGPDAGCYFHPKLTEELLDCLGGVPYAFFRYHKLYLARHLDFIGEILHLCRVFWAEATSAICSILRSRGTIIDTYSINSFMMRVLNVDVPFPLYEDPVHVGDEHGHVVNMVTFCLRGYLKYPVDMKLHPVHIFVFGKLFDDALRREKGWRPSYCLQSISTFSSLLQVNPNLLHF
jgi:hypothetical protein